MGHRKGPGPEAIASALGRSSRRASLTTRPRNCLSGQPAGFRNPPPSHTSLATDPETLPLHSLSLHLTRSEASNLPPPHPRAM